MIKYLLILSLIFANSLGFSRDLPNFEKFLDILGTLESRNNDFAVGDGGKAISRYQIWRVCYQDAKEYDKSIKFDYLSLTNRIHADKVVTAYCKRYESLAWLNNDYESLARLINGGPNWRNKTSQAKINLDNYWKKFQLTASKIK